MVKRIYAYSSNVKIADFINNVIELRSSYQTMQYFQMQEHIGDLTRKYPIEMIVWNTTNTVAPQTYDQMYQIAEEFLQTVG